MSWRGRKTIAWEDKARPELKKQFLEWGIVHCELRYRGCRINDALGFAHAVKRSQHPEMYRTEDLKRVCLACNHCHNILERKLPAEMERIVNRVIELRWRILRYTAK